MIEIFEGRVGGGKSYNAVKRIAHRLSQGLPVCTNIELHWEALAEWVATDYGVTIQREQLHDLRGMDLTRFHEITPQGDESGSVLIVIDEAHLFFNSRDWSKTSRDLLAFLTQSRKQCTDIIFISQTANNIDKQFRELAAYYWQFRDLRKVPVPVLGCYASTLIQIFSFGICSGEVLLAVQFDYDRKTWLSREWMTINPKVTASYNTMALLSKFPRSGTASKLELQKAKSGGVVVRVFMLILLLGFVGWSVLRGWRKAEKPAPAQAAQPQPQPQPQLVPASTAPQLVPAAPAFTAVRVVEPPPQVVQETFRGQVGPVIRTEAGEYQAGVPCAHGYVESATRFAVQGRRYEGGRFLVIVKESGQSAKVPSPAAFGSVQPPVLPPVQPPEMPPQQPPTPAPEAQAAPVASVETLRPADIESARIKEWVSIPVGEGPRHEAEKRKLLRSGQVTMRNAGNVP